MDMLVYTFVLACLTRVACGTYIPLRLSPPPTPSFTVSPFRPIARLYRGPFEGRLPIMPLVLPRPNMPLYNIPGQPLQPPWTPQPPQFNPRIVNRAPGIMNRALPAVPITATAKGSFDYPRQKIAVASNTVSSNYDSAPFTLAAPLLSTPKFAFNRQIRIPSGPVKGSLDMPVSFVVKPIGVGMHTPGESLVNGFPVSMTVEGIVSSKESSQNSRAPQVMKHVKNAVPSEYTPGANAGISVQENLAVGAKPQGPNVNPGPSNQYQDKGSGQAINDAQRRTIANVIETVSLTRGSQLDSPRATSYQKQQQPSLLIQSNVQSQRATPSTRPVQTSTKPQYSTDKSGGIGTNNFFQGSKQHSIHRPVMQGVIDSMTSQVGQSYNEPMLTSSKPNIYESKQGYSPPKQGSVSVNDQHTYQPTQKTYSDQGQGMYSQYTSGTAGSVNTISPAATIVQIPRLLTGSDAYQTAANTKTQTQPSHQVNVILDNIIGAFDAQPVGDSAGKNIMKISSKDMQVIDTLGASKHSSFIEGVTSSDRKNTIQDRMVTRNQIKTDVGSPSMSLGAEQANVLTLGPAKINHSQTTLDTQLSGTQHTMQRAFIGKSGTTQVAPSSGRRLTQDGASNHGAASTNGQNTALDMSTPGEQQRAYTQGVTSASGQYGTVDMSTSGGQQLASNQGVTSASGQYGTVDMSTSGGQQLASNQGVTSASGQYGTVDLLRSGGQKHTQEVTFDQGVTSTTGQYGNFDKPTSGGQQLASNQADSTTGQYGNFDMPTSAGQPVASNQAAPATGQFGNFDTLTSGGQPVASNQAASTSGQYGTVDSSTSFGQQLTKDVTFDHGVTSTSGQYGYIDLPTSGGQQLASNQAGTTSGQYGHLDTLTSGGQQLASNQAASTTGQYGNFDMPTFGGQQLASNQAGSTTVQYGNFDMPTSGGQQLASNQATSTSGQYGNVDSSTTGGQQLASNQAASTTWQYGNVDSSTTGGQQLSSNQAASTTGQYGNFDMPTSGGHQLASNQAASTNGQYGTVDLPTSGGQQLTQDVTFDQGVTSTSVQYGNVDMPTSGGQQLASNQAASTTGQYGNFDMPTSDGQQLASNQAASTSGQYGNVDSSTSGGQQPASNQAASTTWQYGNVDSSTSGGQQQASNQAASTTGQYGNFDVPTSGGQPVASNQAGSTNGQYGTVDLPTSGGQQITQNVIFDQGVKSTSGQYGYIDMPTSGGQQLASNQAASTTGQYGNFDMPTSGGHQLASNQAVLTSGQYGNVDSSTSGGQELASNQAASTTGQYGNFDMSTIGGQQQASNQAASTSGQYGSFDVPTSGGQQLASNQAGSTNGQYGTVDLPTSGGQQLTQDVTFDQGVTSTSGQYGYIDMPTSGGQQLASNQAGSTTGQYGNFDMPTSGGQQLASNQAVSTTGQFGNFDTLTSGGQPVASNQAATTSRQYGTVDSSTSIGQQLTQDVTFDQGVTSTSGQYGYIDMPTSGGQQLASNQAGSTSGQYGTVDSSTFGGQELASNQAASANGQYGYIDMPTSGGQQLASNQAGSTSGQYGYIDMPTSGGQQLASNQAASTTGQYGNFDMPTSGGQQLASNQAASTSGQYGHLDTLTSGGQQLASNQAVSTSGQYGHLDTLTSGGQELASNQAASTNGQYGTVDLPTSGGQQLTQNVIFDQGVTSTTGQYEYIDMPTSGGQQLASNQAGSTTGQYGHLDTLTSGGQQVASNQAGSTTGQYGNFDMPTSGGQQLASNQAVSTSGQYGNVDSSTSGGQQLASNQAASTSAQYGNFDMPNSGGQQLASNQAVSTTGQFGNFDTLTSGGQQLASNQAGSTSGQYGTVDLSTSIGQQLTQDVTFDHGGTSTSGQYGYIDIPTSGGQQLASNQAGSTSGQYGTVDSSTSIGQQLTQDVTFDQGGTSTSGQYGYIDIPTSGGQQPASNQAGSTTGQYGTVDSSTFGGQELASNQAASTNGQYGTVDLPTSGGQQLTQNVIFDQGVTSTTGQYGYIDMPTSGGQQLASNQAGSTTGQYGHIDTLTSGGQQVASNQAGSTTGQYGNFDMPSSGGQQLASNQAVSTSGQYGNVDSSTSGGQQLASNQAASTSAQYGNFDMPNSGGQQLASNQAVSTTGQFGNFDTLTSGGQPVASNQAAATSGQYGTVDLSTSIGQQLTQDVTFDHGGTSTSGQYGYIDIPTSGGQQLASNQAGSTSGQYGTVDSSTFGGQELASNQAASTNGQFGTVDLPTSGGQQLTQNVIFDQGVTSTTGQYGYIDMPTSGGQQLASNQAGSTTGQYGHIDTLTSGGQQVASNQAGSTSAQYGNFDMPTSGGQQLATNQAGSTSGQYGHLDTLTPGGQPVASNQAASTSGQYGTVDLLTSFGQQLTQDMIFDQGVTSTSGQYGNIDMPTSGGQQLTRDLTFNQGVTSSNTQYGAIDVTASGRTQALHDLTQSTTNGPTQQNSAHKMHTIKEGTVKQSLGHRSETSSLLVGTPQHIQDQTNLNQYFGAGTKTSGVADQLGAVDVQHLKHVDLVKGQELVPTIAGGNNIVFGMNGAAGGRQDAFYNNVQSGLTGQGHSNLNGPSDKPNIHKQHGALDMSSNQRMVSSNGQSVSLDMPSTGNQYSNPDLSGSQGLPATSGQHAHVDSTSNRVEMSRQQGPYTATMTTVEPTNIIHSAGSGFSTQDSNGNAINNQWEQAAVTGQGSTGTHNQLGSTATGLEKEFMNLFLKGKSQDSQSTNTYYAIHVPQRNPALKSTNTFNAIEQGSKMTIIDNTRSGFSINKNANSIPSNPHLSVKPITKTASGSNYEQSFISSEQTAAIRVGNRPMNIKIAPATAMKMMDTPPKGMENSTDKDKNASATVRARLAVRTSKSTSPQKSSPNQSDTFAPLKSFNVFAPIGYGAGSQQKPSVPSVISETVPVFALGDRQFLSFPEGKSSTIMSVVITPFQSNTHTARYNTDPNTPSGVLNGNAIINEVSSQNSNPLHSKTVKPRIDTAPLETNTQTTPPLSLNKIQSHTKQSTFSHNAGTTANHIILKNKSKLATEIPTPSKRAIKICIEKHVSAQRIKEYLTKNASPKAIGNLHLEVQPYSSTNTNIDFISNKASRNSVSSSSQKAIQDNVNFHPIVVPRTQGDGMRPSSSTQSVVRGVGAHQTHKPSRRKETLIPEVPTGINPISVGRTVHEYSWSNITPRKTNGISPTPGNFSLPTQAQSGRTHDTYTPESPLGTTGNTSYQALLEHRSKQSKQNSSQTLKASKCMTQICIDKEISEAKLKAYLRTNSSAKAIGNMQLDAPPSIPTNTHTDSIKDEVSTSNRSAFTSSLNSVQYNTKPLHVIDPLPSKSGSIPAHPTHPKLTTGSSSASTNTGSYNIPTHPTNLSSQTNSASTHSNTASSTIPTLPTYPLKTIGTDSTYSNTASSTIPTLPTYPPKTIGTDDTYSNTGSSTIPTLPTYPPKTIGTDDTYSNTGSSTIPTLPKYPPKTIGTDDTYSNTGSSNSPTLPKYLPTTIGTDDTYSNTGSSTIPTLPKYPPKTIGTDDTYSNTGSSTIPTLPTYLPTTIGTDDTYSNTDSSFVPANPTNPPANIGTVSPRSHKDSAYVPTHPTHLSTNIGTTGTRPNTDSLKIQTHPTNPHTDPATASTHTNTGSSNIQTHPRYSPTNTGTDGTPSNSGSFSNIPTHNIHASRKTETVGPHTIASPSHPANVQTKTGTDSSHSNTASSHIPTNPMYVTLDTGSSGKHSTKTTDIPTKPTHKPTNSEPTSTHPGSSQSQIHESNTQLNTPFSGKHSTVLTSHMLTHLTSPPTKTGPTSTLPKTIEDITGTKSKITKSNDPQNQTHDFPTAPDSSSHKTFHNQSQSGRTHDTNTFQEPSDTTSSTLNQVLLENHSQQSNESSNKTLKASKCITQICINKEISEAKLKAYLRTNSSAKAIGNMQLDAPPSIPTNTHTDSIKNEASTSNRSAFTSLLNLVQYNTKPLHMIDPLPSKSGSIPAHPTHPKLTTGSSSASTNAGSYNIPTHPTNLSSQTNSASTHSNTASSTIPTLPTYPFKTIGTDSTYSNTGSSTIPTLPTYPPKTIGTDDTYSNTGTSTIPTLPKYPPKTIGTDDTYSNTGSSTIPTLPTYLPTTIETDDTYSNTDSSYVQAHHTNPPANIGTASSRSHTDSASVPTHPTNPSANIGTASARSHTDSASVPTHPTNPPANIGTVSSRSHTDSASVQTHPTNPSANIGTASSRSHTASASVPTHPTNPSANIGTASTRPHTESASVPTHPTNLSANIGTVSSRSYTDSAYVPTHPTNPPANIGTVSSRSYTDSASVPTHPTNPPANIGTASSRSHTDSASVPTHPTNPSANIGTVSSRSYTDSAYVPTHPTNPPANIGTVSSRSYTDSASVTTHPTNPPANIGTVTSRSNTDSASVPTLPTYAQTNTRTASLRSNTGSSYIPTHSTVLSANTGHATANSNTDSSNIPTLDAYTPKNTGSAGTHSRAGFVDISTHPTYPPTNTETSSTHSNTRPSNVQTDPTFAPMNTGAAGIYSHKGSPNIPTQPTQKPTHTVTGNLHLNTGSSIFKEQNISAATNTKRGGTSNMPTYPTPTKTESSSNSLLEIVNAHATNIPTSIEKLTHASTIAPRLPTQHSAIGITHTAENHGNEKITTSVEESLRQAQRDSNTPNSVQSNIASNFQIEPIVTPVPGNIQSSLDIDGGTLHRVTPEKHLTRSAQVPKAKCTTQICIDKQISAAKVQSYFDNNASPKGIGKLLWEGTSNGETQHINTVFIKAVVHQTLDQPNTVSQGQYSTATMKDVHNHMMVQSQTQSHHTQNTNTLDTASGTGSIPTQSAPLGNCSTGACIAKMIGTKRQSYSTQNTSQSAMGNLQSDRQPLPTDVSFESHSNSASTSKGSSVTSPQNAGILHSHLVSNSSRIIQGKNKQPTQKSVNIPSTSSRCHTPNCINQQVPNATLNTNMTNNETSTITSNMNSKPVPSFHTSPQSTHIFQEQSSVKGNTFTPPQFNTYSPKPAEGQSATSSKNSINQVSAPQSVINATNIPHHQHSPSAKPSRQNHKPQTHHVGTANTLLSPNSEAKMPDHTIQHYAQRHREPMVSMNAVTIGNSHGEASALHGRKQSKPQTVQHVNKGLIQSFGSSSRSNCNKTMNCINTEISDSLLSAYLSRKVGPTPIGKMSRKPTASDTQSEFYGNLGTGSAPSVNIQSTRDSDFNIVNHVPQQPREASSSRLSQMKQAKGTYRGQTNELNQSGAEVEANLSSNRTTHASGLSHTDRFMTFANALETLMEHFSSQAGTLQRESNISNGTGTGVSHEVEAETTESELHVTAGSTEMGVHSANGISSPPYQGITSHDTLHKKPSLSGINKAMGLTALLRGKQMQNGRLVGGGEKSIQAVSHSGTDQHLSTSTDAASPAPPSPPLTNPPTLSRGDNSPTSPGMFDYTVQNGQERGYSGTTNYGPINDDLLQFLSTQGFNSLDSYLQNEINQALDSPVPHTSNSASSQSQGPNRGTGTTTSNVMKTPTHPQSNTLPLGMSTTPGSKQFQLPTRSALSIDVQIPHTAGSPPSSQQGVNPQTYGPPGPAVNDNTRPNLANEAIHNSNNVVFDVTMGIQQQRKQPNALRSQEGTLSKRSSTQTVTSGTLDPSVHSGQNTASHLSTVDAGFVSMSGGGTTQSRPSAQGHSHQQRFMTLDGIKTLQRGTSNTQAGTSAGEGHDTKASELQSNVNTDGISHGSSQQDSSATTRTSSISFNSQDVGGARMDPNQHSGGTTNAMDSEMNTIPINAYTSRPLMNTNAGTTFFDRTSLIASVANRIPSDIFTTQNDVQSSHGAGLLTAAMAAAATYERTSTGAPKFNQGLDSVSFNRQPISQAAHQKIVGAPEFYQRDSRYLDGDQGESEGQEMSQNMVNIDPLLLHFGVSKERQMSPHDSQQFLSNSERSAGYSEYSPMTSFPLI